jgi:hypothetical protein
VLKFFRQINLLVGIYYADMLILNEWDTLTNLLSQDIETLIYWGQRAEKYAKSLNK